MSSAYALSNMMRSSVAPSSKPNSEATPVHVRMPAYVATTGISHPTRTMYATRESHFSIVVAGSIRNCISPERCSMLANTRERITIVAMPATLLA